MIVTVPVPVVGAVPDLAVFETVIVPLVELVTAVIRLMNVATVAPLVMYTEAKAPTVTPPVTGLEPSVVVKTSVA